MRDILVLIGFIILCFGVAALGSLSTLSSVDTWYALLDKPTWTPPGYLFGPVWGALYLIMAVAAWTVWKKERSPARSVALKLFFAQLLFNWAWSWIFFGLREPLYAAIEIVVLLLLIGLTIIKFFNVSRLAAALLGPYFLWTTFATFLNIQIARMNP